MSRLALHYRPTPSVPRPAPRPSTSAQIEELYQQLGLMLRQPAPIPTSLIYTARLGAVPLGGLVAVGPHEVRAGHHHQEEGAGAVAELIESPADGPGPHFMVLELPGEVRPGQAFLVDVALTTAAGQLRLAFQVARAGGPQADAAGLRAAAPSAFGLSPARPSEGPIAGLLPTPPQRLFWLPEGGPEVHYDVARGSAAIEDGHAFLAYYPPGPGSVSIAFWVERLDGWEPSHWVFHDCTVRGLELAAP